MYWRNNVNLLVYMCYLFMNVHENFLTQILTEELHLLHVLQIAEFVLVHPTLRAILKIPAILKRNPRQVLITPKVPYPCFRGSMVVSINPQPQTPDPNIDAHILILVMGGSQKKPLIFGNSKPYTFRFIPIQFPVDISSPYRPYVNPMSRQRVQNAKLHNP